MMNMVHEEFHLYFVCFKGDPLGHRFYFHFLVQKVEESLDSLLKIHWLFLVQFILFRGSSSSLEILVIAVAIFEILFHAANLTHQLLLVLVILLNNGVLYGLC